MLLRSRLASAGALTGCSAMCKSKFRNLLRALIGLVAIAAFGVLAACEAPISLGKDVQSGPAAYSTMDVSRAQVPGSNYRIGPLDAIDVNIYEEPDLSMKAVAVDAAGNVSLPLIGSIPAAGKTTSELSNDIAARLSERYMKNPQVSVTVATSVSQKVTVGGEVNEPGIFPIQGPTTLLQTVALAKGTTRTAKLNEVVVFRNINGKRMAAVFDIKAIGVGRYPDPAILGNDIVIVGFSPAKSMWRDILSSVPILNIFTPVL
jgi:polysaccharide biosynthesis/export protein